jgi:hypothetical protein
MQRTAEWAWEGLQAGVAKTSSERREAIKRSASVFK